MEKATVSWNEAFLRRLRAAESWHFFLSTFYLWLVSVVAGGLAWLIFAKPVLTPPASVWVAEYPLPVLYGTVGLLVLLNVLAQVHWWRARRRRREVIEDMARYAPNEQLLLVDPMTGAFSRRYLDDLIPREASRADRRETTLSFLRIEVEGWEEFVEQAGPQAGEHVLHDVVQLFKVIFRPTDAISRYDIHTFMIVMPETSKHGALVAVRRLLDKVENWNLAKPIPGYLMRLSYGVASYYKGVNIYDVLAAAADRALLDRDMQLPAG